MDAKARLTVGLLAAAAVMATAAPLGAQNRNPDDKTVIDPDTTPAAKALDRRFREMLNRVPDAKDSNDPWRSVRAAETTAKTKPKDDKKHPAAAAVK